MARKSVVLFPLKSEADKLLTTTPVTHNEQKEKGGVMGYGLWVMGDELLSLCCWIIFRFHSMSLPIPCQISGWWYD